MRRGNTVKWTGRQWKARDARGWINSGPCSQNGIENAGSLDDSGRQ